MNGASRNSRQGLLDAQPQDTHQSSLKARLLAYLDEGFIGPEEEAAWAACVLAFISVCNNHYGIGALIVDDAFQIVCHGHNEVCGPPFRSDAHAEMVVLDNFERTHPNRRKDRLTLYTSLEPCPMCYTRILISGLSQVFYVADDAAGGMVRRRHLMPDYWRAMEDRCRFSRAAVREPLRALATDILNYNLDDLGASVALKPLAVGGTLA